MDDPEGATSRHLTTEEVARTVDGTLSPDERRGVEAHLKDCEPCRREVVDVQRLVRRRRRKWGLTVAAPAAAAAILAAILLVNADGPLPSSGDRNGAVRAGDEAARTAEIVQPADEGVVEGDSVLLVWRPVPGATRYVVHVTDAAGSVLVTESVSDTTFLVSRAHGLTEGAPHFWYVDMLLDDGRALSTGTHRFRLAP